MTASDIASYLSAIEINGSLSDEKNFEMRTGAIEFLEIEIMHGLEGLVRREHQPELASLQSKASQLMSQLESVNTGLFQKLRSAIRTGSYKGNGFKELLNEYLDNRSGHSTAGEPRYDSLDVFLDGVMGFRESPREAKDLGSEMVYYQKTPARIAFDIVTKAHFAREDVFFDLGSGLGQVAMLVNLTTGIPAIGVEFDPGYCDYARQRAAELNLSEVNFINADAREVDYSDGTVFFMFTPFIGSVLQSVLDLLKKVSLKKKIRIITLGPCTMHVASQSWLNQISPKDNSIYKPGFFASI